MKALCTTGVAVAAVLAIAAAPAGAEITGITVEPGISSGSSSPYGTGCAYTVTANAAPGEYVSFYDSQRGSFDPPWAIPVGPSGIATAIWTPQERGAHTLHAVQIGGEKSVRVEVGTGIDLGIACLVLP
ncbi:hypothetical protein [Nocardia asteroides]|uniref:hypothetical protein n=1 Tax=Nocardia asteroides TaxID=1824 RepID=UPI001E2EE807|nr:hypothetical protein [Nocardia asteroides]UGT61077.1 hypothetical protein LTT61_28720 [Nocardia asteroides]